MYRLLLAVAVTLGSASVTFAQNGLKPDELRRIKAATVYVKVTGGRSRATGSGFLVKTVGDTGYLVTNDHVVDLAFGSDAMPDDGGKNPAAVSVVFDSGTSKEREVKAVIVAADPDRDLAVLKVAGVKELPPPLDIAASPELVETMQVFVCGFPFGSNLAEGDKNPEISIGPASISSIRREVADGPVSSIQVNGALNPGNSGGPVVAADGKLVGVAVKTVRGAGLGIAIPQHEVAAIMRGRVGRTVLRPAKPDEEPKADISAKLEVGLLDPLKNIKSVTAHVLPGSQPTPKTPMPPGPIAGAKKVTLRITDDRASADVTAPDRKGFVVQWELETAEGKMFTNAVAVPVGPTGPGRIGRPPSPADAYGPQRTPDGKLKLASGVILPLPKLEVEFPKASNSESVSVVNASPEPFVGKTVRMDAITACILNVTPKPEYELQVETDSANAPSQIRVVLPKDLALQVSDLGIPELVKVILQVKFPVRVIGKLVKPAPREQQYSLLAESLEFLDDGKPVTTLKAEAAPPAGKPTLSVVNRFPDKFVGQTLTVDALVKGTRTFSGKTGVDLLTVTQAAPLNLDFYTSRSIATQVESDIPTDDLPARVRVTVEVKGVHGQTQKGVLGVTQIDLMNGDKVGKTLKASAAVEYPPIPATAKTPNPTPSKPADAPKVEEKAQATVPAAKPAGGDNTMLIVALAAAVVLVLGGGFVLLMAMRKSKAVENDISERESVPPKPGAKKQSAAKTVVKRPVEPAPRAKPPAPRKAPPPADDNPFANFE